MKIPKSKRINIGLVFGTILGLFCVLGVGTRIGFSGNLIYLIGMWYNRVIMGLMVGLADQVTIIEKNSRNNSIIRGAIIGLIVTTGILLSSSFKDIPSFFAGIVYGVIIDYFISNR